MFEFFINRFKFKPKFDSVYLNAKLSYLNRIRFSVSLFYFAMGLCFASWASRIPDVKTALSLNEAALGSILFAVPMGQLAIMPFSGKMVTRFGSKAVLLAAMALYVVSLLALGWANGLWQLSAALFFFGMSGNLSNIAVNTQGVGVEVLFKKAIMSSFHGAWSIAGFTGAIIGLGMVALNLTPLQHFAIVSVLVVGLVVYAERHLIVTKEKIKKKKQKFFSKPDPTLLSLGVIGFCVMASEGVMFDWSGVYFKEIIHAPGALVIVGYTSFMIMMALGRFVGDGITHKFGRKKVLQISGVMISVGLFTAVLLPKLIVATLAFMLVGLGVSTVVPTIYSVAGKSQTVPAGEALTIVSSVSFLGFLLGPPVIGYVAEMFSLRVSFALIGVFGFLIAILVSRIKAFDE
ncbi:MFS transporter [Flavobacterium caeni]|uniref:Fucose permease n=1 Tax=Flavobacterium caeni TaxID=490189 RepID=A0A1G5E7I8_9FLAO|nr:MFS transporter [Flavobacterium caeni]SCY22650.1 Fucose permease [Flavobacterium caeni]